MAHRSTVRATVAVAIGLMSVGAGGAAAALQSTPYRVVTVRHAPTGFSISAPEGFRLSLRNGVYVLRKGSVTMSFTRLDTRVSPAQFGSTLLRALGGRVLVRAGDARHFVAAVAGGTRNDHFVVERFGSRLAVTTSTTSRAAPVALETLRQVGRSARGGVGLRTSRAAPSVSPIPLRPYRAPDGGATALLPSGWDVESRDGTIQGSSARGAFLFGFSFNIPLERPPGSPPSFITGPYLSAAPALVQVFPRLAQSVSGIRIRRVVKDAILPSFTSSGMILFDYRLNGRPWTGVATVATDHPSKYSNFLWNFYYSGIGVPRGSSPAVGVALLRAWRSWNPSGAIAARTRAAARLISETNQIWQETSEFRSRIADQQSRDVGCLLSGYYIVEDNARRYGLPALPCGQIYTERD